MGLHVIWTTEQRWALVTPELERDVYRCISAEAEKLGCRVLAINGMPDHVHVVVYLSVTTSISNLLKQMKGASSSLARNIVGTEPFFQWADGYAVFSLSRVHRKNAIAYVERQKEHHANQTLRKAWEEASEGDIPNGSH
ncbi:IS200/IS605 family transposase [Armatimonas sp.]|uniref:IS200/IS605 family transposase n=1 Tax=Armatimonas sp. TaxID=1872638 RepID=UPI003752A9E7